MMARVKANSRVHLPARIGLGDRGVDLRPVQGPDADLELAVLARALGNPVRVQILRLLLRSPTCICRDIVEKLPLAQSTISQHLNVLKDAGLIRGEASGASVSYCVEPGVLRRLQALLVSL
jgi:DNA-binding transcriptional ArsR family regulator